MTDEEILTIKGLTAKNISALTTRMAESALLLDMAKEDELSSKFQDLNAYIAYALRILDIQLEKDLEKQFMLTIPLASHTVLLRSAIRCCSDLADIMRDPEAVKNNKRSIEATAEAGQKLEEYINFAQRWYTEYEVILDKWSDKE